MGLFSSKKKTKVYTSVVRVIEDSQVPDSAKASVLKAIMRDQNMVDHLIDGLNESIALKAERMYEYARKHYAYGLPVSSMVSNLQGQDLVRQVIENQVGQGVTLDYFQFAPINSLHVAWQTLVNQYGYDAQSNEIQVLSSQQGVPVYLKDMVAVYTQASFDEAEPGALDQWGTSPSAGYTPERPAGTTPMHAYTGQSKYAVDPSAGQDRVDVSYVFEVETEEPGPFGPQLVKTLREGSLSIPISGFDEESEYYQVKYHYTVSSGTPAVTRTYTRYWTYEDGAGEYPEIDAAFDVDLSQLGSYFPFAYVRHDRSNRTADIYRDTPEYLTTRKMLKYLSMDYDDIAESIHENPDIGDIEQALMIWAVPAKTENEMERRYLFEYFNLLYYNSQTPYELTGDLVAGLDEFTRRGSQAVVIQDKEFTMTLSYQGIGKRKVAGKIGDGTVGSYDSLYGNEQVEEEYLAYGEGGREEQTRIVDIPYHSYRMQVNSTFYEEVRVFNPRLTYHIWRGKNVVATGDSENLLIPLDHAICDLFNLLDREELYSRSLHFVFNTRITTKEKWYQSGLFKAVMIIAAVVLTIFYPPGGAAAWAAIAAMGTAVYIMAIIAFVLVSQQLVGYVLKRVAEALGGEWAMVLAVAMIVYGGYSGLQKGLTLLQSAGTLIVKLGTGLIQAGFSQRLTEQMEALDKKTGEFNLLADKLTKELEEIQKLLDVDSWLNPFEFIGEEPLIVWGEAPQDLYNRTVHSGNIGMVGIDMVSSYVDAALTLPKLNNTVGDTFYA
jgi:hypothetical protein